MTPKQRVRAARMSGRWKPHGTRHESPRPLETVSALASVVGRFYRAPIAHPYRGPVVRSIWVAELCISDRTAQKIHSEHHISPDEVRDAVVCVAGLDFAWDDDPERGLRAMVKTYIRGDKALVVLYPVEDGQSADRWNLGSVYFTNQV